MEQIKRSENNIAVWQDKNLLRAERSDVLNTITGEKMLRLALAIAALSAQRDDNQTTTKWTVQRLATVLNINAKKLYAEFGAGESGNKAVLKEYAQSVLTYDSGKNDKHGLPTFVAMTLFTDFSYDSGELTFTVSPAIVKYIKEHYTDENLRYLLDGPILNMDRPNKFRLYEYLLFLQQNGKLDSNNSVTVIAEELLPIMANSANDSKNVDDEKKFRASDIKRFLTTSLETINKVANTNITFQDVKQISEGQGKKTGRAKLTGFIINFGDKLLPGGLDELLREEAGDEPIVYTPITKEIESAITTESFTERFDKMKKIRDYDEAVKELVRALEEVNKPKHFRHVPKDEDTIESWREAGYTLEEVQSALEKTMATAPTPSLPYATKVLNSTRSSKNGYKRTTSVHSQEQSVQAENNSRAPHKEDIWRMHEYVWFNEGITYDKFRNYIMTQIDDESSCRTRSEKLKQQLYSLTDYKDNNPKAKHADWLEMICAELSDMEQNK